MKLYTLIINCGCDDCQYFTDLGKFEIIGDEHLYLVDPTTKHTSTRWYTINDIREVPRQFNITLSEDLWEL